MGSSTAYDYSRHALLAIKSPRKVIDPVIAVPLGIEQSGKLSGPGFLKIVPLVQTSTCRFNRPRSELHIGIGVDIL